MSETNTTVIYSPEFLAQIFKDPPLVVNFFKYGYLIIFLIGFPGNLASLLTFSQPTLRKVSTGCLFLTLATSNILYLLMCIVDSLEFGLKINFYSIVQYGSFCRFRTFTSNVALVASSWILVFISIDRWLRVRFPFKSSAICIPKYALIAVGALIILDILFHSHILTPMFGTLIPGFSVIACGSADIMSSYNQFYYMTWSIIKIFTDCLVPASIMLIALFDIIISIRSRKRILRQPINFNHDDNKTRKQKLVQNQLLLLMLASVLIFLITSLPLAICKIQSPRATSTIDGVFQVVSIWTGLGWFQSIFFAISFYIHCLTSKLFRKEFQKRIGGICGKHQATVSIVDDVTGRIHFQLHQLSFKSQPWQ